MWSSRKCGRSTPRRPPKKSNSAPPPAACWPTMSPPIAILPRYARSVRDGYAVRAADLPGQLRVIGEVRAGERFTGEMAPGEAVEIMTGAPIPAGADAVVMVEHTRREGDRVHYENAVQPGQFINPQGCEAAAGEVVLHSGKRLDYTDIAMLAAFGRTRIAVYRKPVAAIVATGDEIVEVGQRPEDFQIRNSNAYSLAAQVTRAGGVPRVLPIARDTLEHTRAAIAQGLEADLLLLSGGVSAGKYDVVEQVLAGFGAEFFFDRVLIQPGQPLVFGRAAGKFFFGLPGNPSSTMVTFEIFARAALELLDGQQEVALPMTFARLTRRVPPPPRTHPLPPRAPQRRWRRNHARRMARLRRYPRPHSRQCLPRHRPGPGRISSRRVDPGAP